MRRYITLEKLLAGFVAAGCTRQIELSVPSPGYARKLCKEMERLRRLGKIGTKIRYRDHNDHISYRIWNRLYYERSFQGIKGIWL